MIKNLEELKEYNIICTNTDEIKDCFEILRELGFETDTLFIGEEERIVSFDKKFFYSTKNIRTDYKDINFYQFKKQTKKFLKEKEKQLPDFEVAEDGRIIKINNFESNKRVYLIDAGYVNCSDEEYIFNFKPDFLKNYCKYGLIFSTKEARNKMLEKQEIYIKLKNLAEKLNNKEKFDWNDTIQKKYYLYYDYKEKKLSQGFNSFSQRINTVYCLDYNFLEIAKKEIGEENLLKLFED